MKVSVSWKQFWYALARIHIVDKFPIGFMILLMFQSLHSLLADRMVSRKSAHIEIIVRTSATVIFGYFLTQNSSGTLHIAQKAWLVLAQKTMRG